MRNLTSPLQIARHLLYTNAAWLWFFELPLRDGTVARVVKNTGNLFANGKVWQAAALSVEIPPETSDGALGQITVKVPNVARILVGWADDGGFPPVAGEEGPGLILGQVARVWLQLSSSLETFDPAMSFEAQVLNVSCTADVGELTLGDASQTVRVPAGVWDRTIAPQLLPSGSLAALL